MASRWREVGVLLYSRLMRLHLECCVHLWGYWRKKNMDLLEQVQKRDTRNIRELEQLCCEDRLRELELFSREKRRIQEDLIAAFQYLKGAYRNGGE